MWPDNDYAVFQWALDRGSPNERRGLSADDVRECFARLGPLCIEVHADSCGVSWSQLLIWRNREGMARVQIDEHRDHTGRDPKRSGMRGEVDGFPDGDGGWYTMPAADAVTSEQASAVLESWLAGGQWWSGLIWD